MLPDQELHFQRVPLQFFPTDTGSLGYLNIYPLILWEVHASIFMAQDLICSNESYNVGSRVWKPLNAPFAQISQWQGHSGVGNRHCACKTIPSHTDFNYKCIINEFLIHSSRRNVIFTRKMKQRIEGSFGNWNRSCMQNQEGKQKPDIEFPSGIMNPSLEFDPRIHITYMSVGSADLQGYQWEVTQIKGSSCRNRLEARRAPMILIYLIKNSRLEGTLGSLSSVPCFCRQPCHIIFFIWWLCL